MDHIQRLEKLVSFFLFTGLILSLFFVYFAQERLSNSFGMVGPAALGSAKFLRIGALLSLFAAVILSLFVSRKKYHYSIFIAFLILVISITLNFLISGADLGNMSELMSTRGIGPWLCLGIIFVGYHDERYANFKKFMYFAVVIISLFAIYNFIDYGIGGWRGQTLSKYRVLATNFVWITPYVFLILKNNAKLKRFRIFVLFMGILLALIIQTRSFLIIYFLTILFDFFNTKNKASYTIFLGIGFVGLIYVVLSTELFSNSFELLVNRGTNDTRSGQLRIFFSQLNFFELVTGTGHYSRYGYGLSQFSAIDNQWLYLIWWAGLLPAISYFYLTVVIPVKMLFRGGLTYETKVECFVLVLWMLALLGLAIFTTVTIDLFFFVICVILGRILYKYSNGIK